MSALPPPWVLVVDDDVRVLASFRRIAAPLRLTLSLAESAEEAWALLDAAAAPPSLIVSDWRMPGMDGLTFLERVHARWPQVRRVLHTGEPVHRVAFGFDVPVLSKPCAPELLRELFLSLDGAAALET